MRRTAFGPLVLRPSDRVALRLTFGKLLQVASAARIGRGQPEVLRMVGLLLCVDVIVTIDTTNLFQLLLVAEPTERTEVCFDRFQFRLLVIGAILRGELADLVEVGMRASFPVLHPPW